MEPPVNDFLKSIPDVVWAAIIASLIAIVGTLGGVLLTLWDNRKRLTAQLTHDAKQRDREREMEIRREVYLAAAEAVAEAQERLGQVASMDIQEVGKKFSGTSLSPATNKVQLIGSEATVKAVSAFTRKYGEALMALMPKKIHLTRIQAEVNELNSKINATQASRREMIQQFQSIPKTPENAILIQNIHNSFQESEKTLEAQMQARDANQALANKLFFELLDESLACTIETGEFLVEANLAVRRELDLPIGEEFYRKMTSDNRKAVKEAFEKYLKDVQESATKPN